MAGHDIEVLQTNYDMEEMLDYEGSDEMVDDDYLSDSKQASGQEEEEELRRTVQAVFELEEALLNQHMSNIQVEFFEGYFVVSLVLLVNSTRLCYM